MSGPNQHHIPVFLQKGFAIRKSRAKRIWVWNAGVEPKEGIIKKTGSKDNFYAASTDDKITELETPLAIQFRAIRDLPVGAIANAEHAANCVLHFSSRTAHLRGTMELGLHQLSNNAASLFDDPDVLANMVGMNAAKPTQQFVDHLWEAVRKHVDPSVLPIPDSVFERMAFAVAREQFSESLQAALPSFRELFAKMAQTSPDLARDSHSNALERIIEADENPRADHLTQLDWHVLEGPSEGTILPDCVVLSLAADGRHGPYLHSDRENTQAVVLPLSSQKVLVGIPSAASLPDIAEINRISAASSQEFFLSSDHNPQIEALHSVIGTRFTQFIEEAVAEAFKGYLSMPAAIDSDSVSDAFGGLVSKWSYQLNLHDFGDAEYAETAGEKLRDIIAPLSQIMPLHRLDTIIFARDYASAVASVDRGLGEPKSTTTIDNNVGRGIAKNLTVLREDEVKAVVVFDATVIHNLTDGASSDAEWALRVIVHELALVAMIEWTEKALPGVLLKPIEGDELDSWLYREANAAIHAYIASHLSAGFGDKAETASSYRELLVSAVSQFDAIVFPARLEYRTDGDLDLLISKTLPVIQMILMFAADLLGHCQGCGEELFDEDGKLELALKEHGLDRWLLVFGADLERFRGRLSKWESFDEFLDFNVHVERLLWQVGMIPWSDGDLLRLEVPLQSDAEHLAAMIEP